MSFMKRFQAAIKSFNAMDSPSQEAPPAEALSEAKRIRLQSLTPREKEIFALLLQGQKMKEIAAELGVQFTTVSFHMTSLYKKLEIHDRAQLFVQYGSMSVPD